MQKILIALLALVAANIALNGGKKTGESTGGLGKDGGAFGDGDGGSCSLGPQYKTKQSCEAAGGTWLSNNPDDILSGMSDLLGQVEQSSDSDLRDDGGLEKLVRETTAEGTTESVQTSGTGGGGSGGGGGY